MRCGCNHTPAASTSAPMDDPKDCKDEILNVAPETNDVVFATGDSKQVFRIPRKNLEVATGNILPGIASSGSTLLEEDHATLKLLFQFVYPERHPSLAEVSLEVLAPLAEAAEKYEVYPAMNICHIRMIKFLEKKEHAERILAYAAKYNYKEVVDAAAPLVVHSPIGDVVRLLPAHLILAWVCYRQQFQDILTRAYSQLGTYKVHSCGDCDGRMSSTLMSDLNLSTIFYLDALIIAGGKQCKRCAGRLKTWTADIENQIKNIQSFSTFY